MSQENVEVVRRWFEFMARGEPPLELAAEHIEIDNIEGWPAQGPDSGHSGVKTWWRDLAEAFETFRIELIDCAPLDGERVLTKNRTVGRFRGTGIPVDSLWASLATVQEAKIARAVGYPSQRHALKAAGLSE